MIFKLTPKQIEANELLAGIARNIMLFGGSRSGKTLLLTRATATRAVKAPKSRHLIARFRLNAVKNSVVLDTFPKVMSLCFPDIKYTLNKTDLYATLPNGSEIWFAGLDDKERTEKILGMEFATIYLNECSQIGYESVELVVTRLAQQVQQVVKGMEQSQLKPRVYYDCNPPGKSHWTYRVFIQKVRPDTKEALSDPEDYASMQINPIDNTQNLADGYLASLQSLSARAKRRFLDGLFSESVTNQLFPEEHIDKWRVTDGVVPDFVRIVVAVDPSGADDENNEGNDAIGIVVAGLGTDGNAYIIEDLTVKAGPATWGKVACDAYDRHQADAIIGETNFGGAMVGFVIQTCRPKTNFKIVTASRGKVQRAEPFSALYEQGKVRHVGYLHKLEDELADFTTSGYKGAKSPNRADAAIWALAALFPGLVKAPKTPVKDKAEVHQIHSQMGWMA